MLFDALQAHHPSESTHEFRNLHLTARAATRVRGALWSQKDGVNDDYIDLS